MNKFQIEECEKLSRLIAYCKIKYEKHFLIESEKSKGIMLRADEHRQQYLERLQKITNETINLNSNFE